MPQWLLPDSLNLIFCLVAGGVWLLSGLIVVRNTDKFVRVGAVGLLLGSVPPLVLAVGHLWQENIELLISISDLAWGPALACLAWSGFGMWVSSERMRSIGIIPLAGMLLYLFRLVIVPQSGLELISIYAPLMMLPLVAASLMAKRSGMPPLGIGAALVGIGLGGTYWIYRLLPMFAVDVVWIKWAIPLGVLGIMWGLAHQKQLETEEAS